MLITLGIPILIFARFWTYCGTSRTNFDERGSWIKQWTEKWQAVFSVVISRPGHETREHTLKFI